jgi:hypothetical protein
MEPADDAYVRALVRQELEALMRERGSSESMSLGSLMVRKSRPSRRSHRNKKRQISTSRDQKQ